MLGTFHCGGFIYFREGSAAVAAAAVGGSERDREGKGGTKSRGTDLFCHTSSSEAKPG